MRMRAVIHGELLGVVVILLCAGDHGEGRVGLTCRRKPISPIKAL
jgi:hypothetical protein